MMSDNGDDQFRASANEESELQALEREKEALESRPHDGFADAARVVEWTQRSRHWMSS